jgi:alanine dehydrogenase
MDGSMSRYKTRVLGGPQIAMSMDLVDYIEAVEAAFGQLAAGRMAVPPVVHIPVPGGAFHIKSAAYAGQPAYVAVKVNGNFPDNPAHNRLPTIQGAIVLCDGRNGALLAVIDSAEITAMRTGAATAVAAKYLARDDATVATIIGCGIQGRAQLLMLLEVLPLKTAYVFDQDQGRAETFAEQMRAETGIRIISVDDFADATTASHVIVTCTSSRSYFLHRRHVAPGTFVAAVGADNADKQELDPDLMGASRVVVDLVEQCAGIGELHHALAAGTMKREDVVAELSEIVAGAKKPAFSSKDIIIFDSTGTAIQDVAAAGIVYERATAADFGLAVELQ